MKEFQPLIGEWHGEGEVPMEPPMKISVETKIERLGEFIVISSVGEPAEMPDSVSIVGGAPSGEPQPMHYFDARGVKRLFMMALEGSTWKIWRAPGEDWKGPHGPGFNQRFIGEQIANGIPVTRLNSTPELGNDLPWFHCSIMPRAKPSRAIGVPSTLSTTSLAITPKSVLRYLRK